MSARLFVVLQTLSRSDTVRSFAESCTANGSDVHVRKLDVRTDTGDGGRWDIFMGSIRGRSGLAHMHDQNDESFLIVRGVGEMRLAEAAGDGQLKWSGVKILTENTYFVAPRSVPHVLVNLRDASSPLAFLFAYRADTARVRAERAEASLTSSWPRDHKDGD